ncbi:MAG: hypothetical protein WBG96_16675, partial [Thermoanaerobaculia bacterium]
NNACTLIEYSIRSDPGGLLSKAQLLMAQSVIRDTLEGMARFSVEHIDQSHKMSDFVRPDGQILTSPGTSQTNQD